jgi:hypothetical protein
MIIDNEIVSEFAFFTFDALCAAIIGTIGWRTNWSLLSRVDAGEVWSHHF